MKNFKGLNLGMVLLNIFLLSTIALIVILLFRIMPESNRILVNIWIAELLLFVFYCLFFYDAGKIKKSGRKHISVLRH